MNVHIYTRPRQPLTRYIDHTLKAMGFRKFWFRTHPRHQQRCHFCGRLRWAKNLRIQVYYDMVYVTCADRCPTKRGRR